MTIMTIMIIVMMMMLQVWSSAISATLASKFLVTGGLLVLPGAQPATGATPGMMGYGMAKVGDSDDDDDDDERASTRSEFIGKGELTHFALLFI